MNIVHQVNADSNLALMLPVSHSAKSQCAQKLDATCLGLADFVVGQGLRELPGCG